ncbi:MAG: hypothetical protein GX589_07510, partial [Deltaproteobacteria bacterium]|nr:hypothetical protein [Deltaproteobacteria bacterium]
SADGTILIWSRDADGAWQNEVLKGHSDWVLCLQVPLDGSIFSWSCDGTLRIWDGTPVEEAS